MKTLALNFLGFSVILACFTTLSICKPVSVGPANGGARTKGGRVIFDARRLWSEAKKAHRQIYHHLEREARQARLADLKRETRSTGTVEEPLNTTSYMRELYKKIVESSVDTPFTQANSIKSLTFLKDPLVDSCHQFTFSLAGVSSTEFILHTKLRLYNAGINIDSKMDRFMRIQVQNSTSSTIKAMNPSENGYVEFEVADIVRPYAGIRDNITFIIEDLKSPPIDCRNDVVKFLDNTNGNTIPALVVYSYERLPDIVNISTDALDRQLQNSNISIKKAPVNSSTLERKRRSTSHGCTRKSLNVSATMVPSRLIGNFTSFKIVMPRFYDAGICGGRCINNGPSAIRHPILIHLLLRYDKFQEDNPYTYKQCCTPVSYKSLTVLGLNHDDMPVIQTIQDMIIDSCQCTDVVA